MNKYFVGFYNMNHNSGINGALKFITGSEIETSLNKEELFKKLQKSLKKDKFVCLNSCLVRSEQVDYVQISEPSNNSVNIPINSSMN